MKDKHIAIDVTIAADLLERRRAERRRKSAIIDKRQRPLRHDSMHAGEGFGATSRVGLRVYVDASANRYAFVALTAASTKFGEDKVRSRRIARTQST